MKSPPQPEKIMKEITIQENFSLVSNGMSFKCDCIPLPGSAILVIQGKKGMLGCGYLSTETADKLGHALAVVTGVANYDDMLAAKVVKISHAAAALGVKAGMSGREALITMHK